MTETAASHSAKDIRPVVARKPSTRGLWLFGILMAVCAGALFASLETSRREISSPSVMAPSAAERGMIASLPPLDIPPVFEKRRLGAETTVPVEQVPQLMQPAPRPLPQPAAPVAAYASAPQRLTQPQPAGLAAPDPAYVYQARPAARAPETSTSDKEGKDRRAHASRLENPSTTVPQGTVMQAVLETALDSNHPGFARAIISRDIYSFDGSRVLVPKGSKLFGEYGGEVRLGQNRALIRWQRLTRPDGTIIDVDSPTADPLGRAGVKGKVDSHFFARFGGAILQSTLDVGVQLAARKATGDTVILGMPGSSQQISAVPPESVQPTLKVRHGTSVSVFVMRDLDFSDVES